MIYALGGNTHDTIPLHLVEQFNPRTGATREMAPLPEGRARAQAVEVHGELYLLGGDWGLDGPIERVDVHTHAVTKYDPDLDAWQHWSYWQHEQHVVATESLRTQVACVIMPARYSLCLLFVNVCACVCV